VIRAAARQAARRGFRAVRDSLVTFTIEQFVGAPTYSPVSDVVTGATQSKTTKGWQSAYSEKDTDNSNVLATDQRLSFPQTNLPFTPKIDAQVTKGDGVWTVRDAKEDGTNTLWILQLRRP
jgi:hypothetical protein